jgi:plastocyanin
MKAFGSFQFPSFLRWFLMIAILIVPQAALAESWQAAVGAQSHDLGRQALAFLPNEIWIHAGDSVTWKVETDEIHTVTFLISGQVRLPFQVGCPGVSPDGSSYDGSACVTTPPLVKGQTFTISFPTAGNFKLVCQVHENMTGVIHVIDLSKALPHDQDFYDDQAAAQREELLSDKDGEGDHDHDGDHDRDHDHGDSHHGHSARNGVITGVGEITATPGGSQSFSVMRFLEPVKVIHAGETIEWNNTDPVTPHTITFGVEPLNPVPPSGNVTVDADGARHATINSTADSVHSGFIVSAPQERIGLPQAPLGSTRFRITFTHAGVYPYICALHDDLGMKGKVIVLP